MSRKHVVPAADWKTVTVPGAGTIGLADAFTLLIELGGILAQAPANDVVKTTDPAYLDAIGNALVDAADAARHAGKSRHAAHKRV